jgi:hypothetical protein
VIETAVGQLTVPELEVLVELNIDLAQRHQLVADDPDVEPESRQIGSALAAWRRARARYFRQESAEAERIEAGNELETDLA